MSLFVSALRRPDFLKRLLDHLVRQETAGQFSYSIVVADNDSSQSAQPVVAEFAARSAIQIRYCVEPRQNIALARNKAVEHVEGDFAAFIDDDEFPEKDWLSVLLSTCEGYGVDGVLGPVKRHFNEAPPEWLAKGHFYDRRINLTGTVVRWYEARTGNVLLRKKVLEDAEPPFGRSSVPEKTRIFSKKDRAGAHLHLVGGCRGLRDGSSGAMEETLHAEKGSAARRERTTGSHLQRCQHCQIADCGSTLHRRASVCATRGASPLHDSAGQHVRSSGKTARCGGHQSGDGAVRQGIDVTSEFDKHFFQPTRGPPENGCRIFRLVSRLRRGRHWLRQRPVHRP